VTQVRTKITGATLSLALLLSFSSVAFADDPVPPDSNDPGIAMLHQAITDFRQDAANLRAECTGELDKATRVACRTSFAALRMTFKEHRIAAIAQHHAFRESLNGAANRPDSVTTGPGNANKGAAPQR
jgi:hypothetical protein